MAWRKPAAHRTYGDVVGPVLAVSIGCFQRAASWSLVHKRYLFDRYTVATVVELDSWRGEPRFACAYVVDAQRYQPGQPCGTTAGQDSVRQAVCSIRNYGNMCVLTTQPVFTA